MDYLPAIGVVALIIVIAVVVTVSKKKKAAEVAASWVPSEAAVISIDRRAMERNDRDNDHPHFRLNVRYEFNGKSYDNLLVLNYWTTRANFPELVTIQSKVNAVGSVFEIAKEVTALSAELKEQGASKEEINRAVSDHMASKGPKYNTIIPILLDPENPRRITVDPSKVEERNGGFGGSFA